MRALSLLSAVTIVVGLVAVVLLALLAVRRRELADRPPEVCNTTGDCVVIPADTIVSLRGVSNDTVCIDGVSSANECTHGYYNADNDYCIYLAEPPDTPCNSSCAKSGKTGTCDGHGECTVAPANCSGYCTTGSSCPELPAAATSYTLNYDVDAFTTLRLTSRACIRNQCVSFVIDLLATSLDALQPITPLYVNESARTVAYPIGARYTCEDYLDDSLLGFPRTCLVAERIVLDPVFERFGFMFQGSNLTLGNGTLPYTASVCLFRFACSVYADASGSVAGSATAAAAGLTPEANEALFWDEFAVALREQLQAAAAAVPS